MGAERTHLVGDDAGERLLLLRGGHGDRHEQAEDHRLCHRSGFSLPDSGAWLAIPYSPGTIKWAVVVPGFMIQTPPCLALSGIPVVAVVAPGTAIVVCGRAVAWSAPRICHHTEPYSGLARVCLLYTSPSPRD